MQLSTNFLQKAKNTLHGLQGFIIFLAWAVTIAVFVKPGDTDGRTRYFFVLCWFCIPALIYQTAVPAFQRTRRFANAYAFVVIDALLAILWFAAVIAVAVWTNAGIHDGEGKDKEKKLKGCKAFAYGSEGKCKLSKVTVGMGVIIFLLFVTTSGISVYNLLRYRKTGSLPTPTPRPPEPIEDQTKDAFSSNPRDDFDDDLEIHGPPADRRGEDDEYALLHTNTEDGTHPGRPLSWGREHAPSPLPAERFRDTDTSYHGGRSYSQPPRYSPSNDPYQHEHGPSRGSSPFNTGNDPPGHHQRASSNPPADPFRDDLAMNLDHGGHANERVRFPAGNYHP